MRRVLHGLFAIAVLSVTPSSRAAPPNASPPPSDDASRPRDTPTTAPLQANGPTDPAAAQALFSDARALMQAGDYEAACPKLEESLRLDYGIGTEFNLADCNEHIGKLASAWAGYLNAAASAKAKNQTQREKVARSRAQALEARLPKLVVEVQPESVGVEIRRDGVVMGAAARGVAVPVDPGPHRVTASAPGKQPWEVTVVATEGETTPVLVPGELPDVPPPPAPPAPPVQVANPPPFTPQPQPLPQDSHAGTTPRTIGWIAVGLGLAAIGVGVGFGIDSLSKRNASREHCSGDACDAQGVALRDDAIQSGNVSTISTLAGSAALVAGVVLVLTAPRSRKVEPLAGALQAVPTVATNGGGIVLRATLP